MAGIFKPLTNVQTGKDNLEMLVDVINMDISSSDSRRKYQQWVSASSLSVPGVTSSLYQTVYDQDFTLQTANPIVDMSVGFHSSSAYVTTYVSSIDSNGKYYFPSNTIQMREKMDIYKLHAKALLGDSNARFEARVSDTNFVDIKEALFLDFKRLWVRDKIKPETFALRFLYGASISPATNNLALPGDSSTVEVYTDASSTSVRNQDFGGEYTTVVNATTNDAAGLLFLNKGVVVLDMASLFEMTQTVNGSIHDATSVSGTSVFTGQFGTFLVSGSVDNIVDHIASTRVTGSITGETSMTFQNITNINSQILFCEAAADEFNYSSNPTYADSTTGRIVVIESGQEDVQQAFTFITGIGFYDEANNLLAVAKLSRPVLKTPGQAKYFSSRLDY
jgi:hypothetical protein